MRDIRWLVGALLVILVIGGVPVLGPAAGEHPAPPPGMSAFEHVHALAVGADGQTLWLGSHGGLFRSEDGGTSWRPVGLSAKHNHLDIMALAADPKDPRTLYVATHEAGVVKTQDGGASWTAINTGLGGADVHGLALDPNEPRKHHAAVRGTGEGVYRTRDGGGKWVRVDDGPKGEVKVLASVNISTGMGGIFLMRAPPRGSSRARIVSEGGQRRAGCLPVGPCTGSR